MKPSAINAIRVSLWIPIISGAIAAGFLAVLCIAAGFRVWAHETTWGGRLLQLALVSYPVLAFTGLKLSRNRAAITLMVSLLVWSLWLAAFIFFDVASLIT